MLSEARASARLATTQRDAFERLAAHHDRTISDELRRAVDLWLTVAGAAVTLDPDVLAKTEPAIAEGRLHDLRRAATDRIGDAFPYTEPEHVLAALAGGLTITPTGA